VKTFFPEITPFHTFFLETGSQHRVYVEQSGNPAGIPVIFLHGGPCSGTKPDHRRFFNPDRYHIILMDQRGCGQSQPFGELQNNSTDHLIEDMEHIRQHLRIQQWLLFGGSWGAALALLYAQRYPTHVLAMILRGVFLARQADMDWFLVNGVNHIFPEQWQNLINSVKSEYRHNIAQGLFHAVFGNDSTAAFSAAKAWQSWGGITALGHLYQPHASSFDQKDLLQVQMELHYARNRYFIEENQILENCASIAHIPATIIHGQYDLTCPLASGWSLKEALPNAKFVILPNSGHVARGEEMINALVLATDEIAEHASF